jgi:5-methylcytosine-specific restriction endonuclease McrA
MINHFKRYQVGLSLKYLFPQVDKSKCACGCNNPLLGRKKRWASKKCQEKALKFFFIIKGDVSVIREELFFRDNGKCFSCGIFSKSWDAHHIIPVFKGGGACDLTNFQTLCKECHKKKTRSYNLSHHIENSLQEV